MMILKKEERELWCDVLGLEEERATFLMISSEEQSIVIDDGASSIYSYGTFLLDGSQDCQGVLLRMLLDTVKSRCFLCLMG